MRIGAWIRVAMVVVLVMYAPLARGASTTRPSAVVNGLVDRLAGIVEPAEGVKAQTFLATVKIAKIEGVPKAVAEVLVQGTAELALQAPDHVGLVVRMNEHLYAVCRDGQEIWAHVPEKKFGVVGKPGVVRFAADPKSIDGSVLAPFKLPMSATAVKWSLMVASMDFLPEEKLGGEVCDVVAVAAPERITSLLGLPPSKVEVAVRRVDRFPARIRYDDGKIKAEILLENPRLVDAWPAEHWKIHPNAGDHVETTAVSHLTKFMEVAQQILQQKIPTLPPAKGERRVHAYSGKGRLEIRDGARVMFLVGTPEEMGRQQGELLKGECRDLVEKVL